MNAKQRQFLVDRIQKKVKDRVKTLQDLKEKMPNAANYLFQEILAGKLKLQPPDVTKEALKQKALAARDGDDWLTNSGGWGGGSNGLVTLGLDKLVVLPKELDIERKRVIKHNSDLQAEIEQLKVQLETIEVRVQLASDKTLQGLINDVDDMGDIKLLDTKLKLLG